MMKIEISADCTCCSPRREHKTLTFTDYSSQVRIDIDGESAFLRKDDLRKVLVALGDDQPC